MPTDLPPSAALEPARLQRLLGLYPALAALRAQDRPGFDAVLGQRAQVHDVPTGAVLFDEGAPCRGFSLVLRGCIRVARGSPGGRSLELYRVAPGEICVVSTACLVNPGSSVPLAAQ
jgi:CRP/FNR family transcriptional regulator, anaerobic regulatory protein